MFTRFHCLNTNITVSEWELVDTSARWGEVGLPCCPDIKYSHVVFTLKLSRRSLFYLVSLCAVRSKLEEVKAQTLHLILLCRLISLRRAFCCHCYHWLSSGFQQRREKRFHQEYLSFWLSQSFS